MTRSDRQEQHTIAMLHAAQSSEAWAQARRWARVQGSLALGASDFAGDRSVIRSLLCNCMLGKQLVASARRMRGSVVEETAIAGVAKGIGEGEGEDRSWNQLVRGLEGEGEKM